MNVEERDYAIEKSIKSRVAYLLNLKKMSVNSASRLFKIPQRTLNRQVNEDSRVGVELVYTLLDQFPEVSPRWLLFGEGDITDIRTTAKDGAAPFYSDLPVTAGNKDSFDPANEIPSGYISMPQWRAEFYFPVSGTSMEPEIHSGDIIGVNRVESLRDVDPDKIYMIVTNEQRMIKRCHNDERNSDILWCVSPNYPSFAILKRDICAMFHVVNRIERL